MPGSARLGCRPIAPRAAAVTVITALLLGGCTGGDRPQPEQAARAAEEPELLRAQLAAPAGPTTVVPAEGVAEAATAASAALFEAAPVVVLAPEDDPGLQDRAAAAAVALGMPLLVTPPATGGAGGTGPTGSASPGTGPAATATSAATDPPVAGTVAAELGRLSPRAVLAYGDQAVAWARRQAGDVPVVTGPDDPAALGPSGGREGLPPLGPSEALEDLLVLVPGGGAGVAAAATAEAAGGRVLAVAGGDPRADPEAIAALAEAPPPERVVAIGSGFGPADGLRHRLEVAATGVELPGGGQVLFPRRRLVALYGHPGTPALGALGEQPAEAAVERARQVAAGYAGLVDEPVVPAFEIITTVASAAPGPDGDYSAESEVADLRPWVDAARDAGVYVVLDLQPGRTDFLSQARRYEELLAEPHVGLALDPEWRLGPGQRHLVQIGSVNADEVNEVAAWLAGFVRERQLPQKLLLLHQFQLRMIGDRARVDTGHDELAVLVHADGFGTPGQKLETWGALRSEPLPGAWWGWKNFIDEDQPTFTPAQTVAVDPTPWFVSYQ